MTDDPADDRVGRFGSGHSEAWIERLAESEGVSREEVVERLVSSYWTLKEIHGLMETTEEGTEPAEGEWPLEAGTTVPETLSEELDEIRERVEGLEEARVDDEEAPSTRELTAQVKMLAQRVAAVEESLVDRQDALGSRLDRELANLETILDYLIETTDGLEEHLDAFADERRADRRRRAEADRLADLKRLASRLGVRTANCEHCNTKVEIALLPTPECPQCDRPFTDVEPATGWFGFGSNVLAVTEEPYLDASAEERPDGRAEKRGDGRVDEGGPSADAGGDDPDDGAGDRFVWGDQRD